MKDTILVKKSKKNKNEVLTLGYDVKGKDVVEIRKRDLKDFISLGYKVVKKDTKKDK